MGIRFWYGIIGTVKKSKLWYKSVNFMIDDMGLFVHFDMFFEIDI